jgi:hypothetical protein
MNTPGKTVGVATMALAFAFVAPRKDCNRPGLMERKIAAGIEGCTGTVLWALRRSTRSSARWRLLPVTTGRRAGCRGAAGRDC